MLAAKWERNRQSKDRILEKAAEYLDRVDQLDVYLARTKAHAPTASQRATNSAEIPSSPAPGAENEGRDFLDKRKPEVEWDSIKGHEEAMHALLEAAELPLIRPSFFTGLRRPVTRILLYGPPGTGKRSMAKALSWRSKRSFVVAKYTDLLTQQKYVVIGLSADLGDGD